MDAMTRHKARKVLIEALFPAVEGVNDLGIELGPGIAAHLAELCLTTLVAISEAQEQLRRDGLMVDDE